jgi:ATP-dependent protease Clp ATPase subunit
MLKKSFLRGIIYIDEIDAKLRLAKAKQNPSSILGLGFAMCLVAAPTGSIGKNAEAGSAVPRCGRHPYQDCDQTTPLPIAIS